MPTPTRPHAPPGTSFLGRLRNALAFYCNVRRRVLSLEQKTQMLEENHNSSVAWTQKTYPEIVEAIGRKLEEDNLDHLAQNLFAAVHRETGALGDRIKKMENQGPAFTGKAEGSRSSEEDSRSKDFYLELERRFRGTQEEIAGRLSYYLPLLNADRDVHNPVLDIGCGRGEWLKLVTEAGYSASGVDLNPINGDFCRSKNLAVTTDDAFLYLAHLGDNSLGTVSAFHLVEHLPFTTLLSLTDEAFRVLKPGGLLIYETPNPENLLVATHSFWIDPTHVRPLPPELLKFLVTQRGFADAEIHRLHPDHSQKSEDAKLQTLLSCPRDYAIVARKPQPT